ncbi:MAG: 4Fe-4S dicluster domain-containing protein, partial [candidate division Zixibacteria bacterium]|nr:4Fe-4S dicluster domain-containing protein [candidate division Zixibacteria bacterium]
HDRVFMGGKYEDASYRLRRANLFIVAVNCTRAGENCFCSSMNTGPKATSGFDLALTEVIASNQHIFVVEIGSEAGAEIMSSIPNREAGEKDIQAAEKAIQKAASNMGRKLDVAGIRETLIDGFDSLHWEDIASRCLTCGNCTMVCPTCFCTDIQDVTDLSGNHAERLRQWDTCFREEFSYIHGGSIRSTDMSRYRQWMMHKLAYWYDQFGVSGCVGCGRCITWCPVGIDITEEARIIREKG